MINDQKLLVIDDDQIRCDQISLLLQFLGYSSDSINSESIINSKYKFADYLCVIIPYSLLKDKSSKIYSIFTSHLLAKQNPVRFILYQEDNHQIDKFLQDQLVGHLHWPFDSNTLLTLLHKSALACAPYRSADNLENMEILRTNFVGSTNIIVEVRKLLSQVSKSNATVLITGESGTGKEVAAKLIHQLSTRKKGPFVPVNCGAIPTELLESELFGHEKGAFTGAINSRQGRFEMAKGGTLFLDEIGDMPLNMQVKLLRVLQEKTFERVGSNKSIISDVRIIAATNSDLQKNISAGKFREDLFYRINVFPIELPPLRKRKDDIPLLIATFIEQQKSVSNYSIRLLDEAISILMQYQWPGNVRELYNLVERLAILYPNNIVSQNDLPSQFKNTKSVIASLNSQAQTLEMNQPVHELTMPSGGIDLKQLLLDTEVNFIRQALLDCNWVVSHAADRLSMRRTTLVEKMRKYGLSRNSDKSSQIIDDVS